MQVCSLVVYKNTVRTCPGSLSYPTPQTIGTSFGTLETNLPIEYEEAVWTLFFRLGARAVSLSSSGDDDVGPRDSVDEDGEVWFKPSFPSTCTRTIQKRAGASRSPRRGDFAGPWTTSVGGTTWFGAAISGAVRLPRQPRPVWPLQVRVFSIVTKLLPIPTF